MQMSLVRQTLRYKKCVHERIKLKSIIQKIRFVDSLEYIELED